MKLFKLNAEYTYQQIEDQADFFDYEIAEFGNELIGEHFIVLKSEYDTICSFVLTSYNPVQGGNYKCIYNDAQTDGFADWYEIHHEVVEILSYYENHGYTLKAREENGIGGVYELAKKLTDTFDRLHCDRQWDGEFHEEIEQFMVIQSRSFLKL